MEIHGPVRGSDFVKTLYSPNGTMTRGTLNNCGNGYTPWGTYMAAEENWAGYFTNKGDNPREHSRYGVPSGTGRWAWELAPSVADEAVNPSKLFHRMAHEPCNVTRIAHVAADPLHAPGAGRLARVATECLCSISQHLFVS